MSLVWSESFDGPQTSTKYTSFSASLTIDTTSGRNGKGIHTLTNTSSLQFTTTTFPAGSEDDVAIVGFAIKYRTSPAVTHTICTFANSGSALVLVRVTTDYKIQLTNPSLTVHAETAAGVLGLGAWTYVEVKVKIHDSTGTVEVRTNAISRASASGLDTKPSSAATVNSVTFHINQQSAGPTDLNYMDDIYICNEQGSSLNDFLGGGR